MYNRGAMKNFRSLKVWEKSHLFTLECYQITATFPKPETYGITSQIRRASSSIPTNIAEGCGRNGNAELHRFLTIAAGSASEVEYLLLLSRDLQYLSNDSHEHLSANVCEIKKMLAALLGKVAADRAAADS
jgi:four helix bundle protein